MDGKKPAALTEWTYQYIKEMILNLEIKPGEQINIEEFTEKLEVSRTPIREAFLKLESEGLIDVRPRVGYFVVEITEQDIQDLFEIREIIETRAARKAAESLTDEELESIKELIQDCYKAVEIGDFQKFVPAEIKFHGFLQENIENRRLLAIMDGLNDLMYRVRVLSLQSQENVEKTLIEHQKILDALVQRDGDLAEKAMNDHLIKVCDRIVKLLQEINY